ncbi:hypothetical protein MNV49_004983 [Pseudohyphozyma bogoriensis]|nr:hypothetical protein MNV49_004983 [Pseudohyphozyma bogoriensis]
MPGPGSSSRDSERGRFDLTDLDRPLSYGSDVPVDTDDELYEYLAAFDPATHSSSDNAPASLFHHPQSPYARASASTAAWAALRYSAASSSSIVSDYVDEEDDDRSDDDRAFHFPLSPNPNDERPRSSFTPDPTMPLFSSLAALLASNNDNGPKQQQQPRAPASADRCFCGKPADEDSIYCSVACGRRDAMDALCGSEDGASSERPSSPEDSSHYRRVRKAEARREQERQRDHEQREKEKKARLGAWRFNNTSPSHSSATSATSSASRHPSSASSISKPRRRASPPHISTRSDSRSTNGTHSSVPSLSTSSVASYSTCDSELSTPATPTFPPTPGDEPSTPPRIKFDPATSTLDDILASEDMYNSFLALTPKGRPRTPQDRTPTAGESLHPGGFGAAGLGLALAVDEERDEVGRLSGIGWQGEQLKERVKGKMARTHQRQKLSFDDVCVIMKA